MLRRALPVPCALLALTLGGAGLALGADLLHPAAASQRCFGAASRDPDHRCSNPRLRLTVAPSPADAQISPNAPCTLTEGTRLMHICAFGTPLAQARERVALVGDSHASHWRAGLEVVARAKRWVGLSNTRSSCSFSQAVKAIGEPARSQCVQWNRDVIHWFSANPDVSTVFVAEVAGEPVVTHNGRSLLATEVSGYIDAWRALPRSVAHIIVIRDTPKSRPDTLDCVQRAHERHQPAGAACAVPRSGALSTDPAEVAARRLHSPRVQVVDLNDFMCDSRRCYPVVGGALVYKDVHHLTFVFDTSLGPYLLRAVNRLMASWR